MDTPTNPTYASTGPKLPHEIEKVLQCSTELCRVASTFRNIAVHAATTPGITPQVFRERVMTEYAQNLLAMVTQSTVDTQSAIMDIPATPPA